MDAKEDGVTCGGGLSTAEDQYFSTSGYSPHLQVTGTPNLIELAKVWEAGRWGQSQVSP